MSKSETAQFALIAIGSLFVAYVFTSIVFSFFGA